MKLKLRPCPLCGCKENNFLYKIKKLNWPIVKCDFCGFIFNSTILTKKDIANLYTSDYFDNYSYASYDDLEENKKLAGRQYLRELIKYKKKGKLLEIGCSSGFLLDEARNLGFETYGLEISDQAKKAKKKSHKVFQGVLEDAKYPNNYFDAIITINTLEHTINPFVLLKEIKRILKPKGFCMIVVPNHLKNDILKINYEKDFVSYHISYFTPRTLKKAINKSGLKIIDLKSNFFMLFISKVLSLFGKSSTVASSCMRQTDIKSKKRPSFIQKTYYFLKNNDRLLIGGTLKVYVTK